MRSKIAIPVAALSIMVVLGGVGYLENTVPLVRAGRGISNPVPVVAAAMHVRARGRTTVATVQVEYRTPAGRLHEQLPRGGHSLLYYQSPVRLVYDRTHPDRVMLADDWPDAHSTSALVKVWLVGVAMIIAGLTLVSIIGTSVWRAKRPRPAPRAPAPSPHFGPPAGGWLTDDPDYASLAAQQRGDVTGVDGEAEQSRRPRPMPG